MGYNNRLGCWPDLLKRTAYVMSVRVKKPYKKPYKKQLD